MKICIVGCGSIGFRYLNILSKKNRVTTAIHDTDLKVKNKILGLNTIFLTTFNDVLNWKPDIAIVCVLPEQHFNLASKLIDNNINVLVEKPITNRISSAKKLEKILEANNNIIGSVVCNLRYHSGVKEIKKNLKKIGKIYYCYNFFEHNLFQMKKQIEKSKIREAMSNNILLDCIHEIDLQQNFFGKGYLRNKILKNFNNYKEIDNNFALLDIEYPNSIFGSIKIDFLQKTKSRGMKIYGDKGNLEWISYGKNPEIINVFLHHKNKKIKLYENYNYNINEQYELMLNDFLNSVKKTNINLQSFTEAIHCLKIVL